MKRRGVLIGVLILLAIVWLAWQRRTSRPSAPANPSSAVATAGAAPVGGVRSVSTDQPYAFVPILRQPQVFIKGDWDSFTESFAQELKDAWGLKNSKLRKVKDYKRESQHQISWTFQQYYEGEEVFGAKLVILAFKKNGEIYQVNNNLEPIDKVNAERNVTLDQAAEIVLQEYAVRMPKLERKDPRPLIFAAAEGALWAWSIRIELEKPRYENFQVLVSAVDGRVLATRTLISR